MKAMVLRNSRSIVLLAALFAEGIPLCGLAAESQPKTDSHPPHVVFVIGEREYDTKTTLPAFAKSELGPSDVRCTFIYADEKDGNRFPGLEAVRTADLLFLSVRRRALPKEQLAIIREYVEAGKPVIGIRTASHAFHTRGKHPEGHAEWQSFDPDVLGGNYTGHHGNKLQTHVQVVADAMHPILTGLAEAEFTAGGSLYKTSPLAETCTPLLMGRVEGAQPEPVAWTNTHKGGRVFYTSLGHRKDFEIPAFRRLLQNAVFWALNRPIPGEETSATAGRTEWDLIPAPDLWETAAKEKYGKYDGFAWYRCFIKVPADWKGHDLELALGGINNADQTYFNGERIGATGGMPPEFKSGSGIQRLYPVPAKIVRLGEYNLLAVRVYNAKGAGGFKERAVGLKGPDGGILLEGRWQFRTGDDLSWKTPPETAPPQARFEQVAGLEAYKRRLGTFNVGNEEVLKHVRNFKGRGEIGDTSQPLSPEEALASFEVQDGLKLELAVSEPLVRQPLYITFDPRGRMWVVQYIQYPFPAGLKVVKYDEHLRAVFDKVPQPPPNHVPGADKITVYEDTDGDGRYDKAKDVITGLNIATAVTLGRGGIWVLNPPYLLFYPDKNADDVPDGPPEVHLSGFGLEDTHAVANSLRWGPDGWLYGAQGSTCTATVKGIRFLGQAIWRYHPETREFEIFAEGGGNTFCVEMDAKGRCWSGHNGGNTRGFHFVQGGCYRKSWAKHGPLINPYAFGFFKEMPHKGFNSRFSHNFLIYNGGLLDEYENQIISVIPLHNRVMASKLIPRTSSFQTEDTARLMFTEDRWFRPVDTKVGPDGAVYIADWYDTRLTHVDPRDTWDRAHGRIYRLTTPDARQPEPFDLSQLSSNELVDLLSHENKWYRQQALRLLGDRRDRSLVPRLTDLVEKNTGQLALEALWALNLSGGFDDDFALRQIDHADPYVRMWTVRLLGDRKIVSSDVAQALAGLAAREPHPEVRSQLASSAKRLPAPAALPIIRRLIARAKDADDVHIPLLLWWALEDKIVSDNDLVLSMLEDERLWNEPIFRQHFVARLGQRYTAERSQENLKTCARLLDLAPSDGHVALLIAGMEEGLSGNAVESIPAELDRKLSELWAAGPPARSLINVGVRLGQKDATQLALQTVANAKAPAADRKALMDVLAERRESKALPVFLKLMTDGKAGAMRAAALNALARFDDPQVAQTIMATYDSMNDAMRGAAHSILVTRKPWAMLLLKAVEEKRIKPAEIDVGYVLEIQKHGDERAAALIKKHWGNLRPSPEEKQARIADVRKILSSGSGDFLRGRQLFSKTCAKCHRMYGEGGKVGPDLTGYERDNMDFMIPAIVDPSLAIREEFTGFTVATLDGQVLSGLIVEDTPQAITLVNNEGNPIRIPRDDIDEMAASSASIMPDGVLKNLSDQDVRDLFEFLTSKSASPAK